MGSAVGSGVGAGVGSAVGASVASTTLSPEAGVVLLPQAQKASARHKVSGKTFLIISVS